MKSDLQYLRENIIKILKVSHPELKGVKVRFIERPRLMRFQPTSRFSTYSLIEVSATGWVSTKFLVDQPMNEGRIYLSKTGMITLGKSA